MKRVIVWGVVVLGLVAIGYWWFKPAAVQPAGMERTAIVERGDLVVSISASGTIEPVERVEVKSKASGEIVVLNVQEGDQVKKGQLVARLDPVTVQNDFDQAEADFKVAQVTREQRETDLNRQQDLFNQHFSSKSELDNARLAYEESGAALVRTRALLASAKDRLEDTEIKAPIDGVVLTRPVEVGQIISSGTTTVTGGTLLCDIANMSQVYVAALVDETDIGRVQVGLRCDVRPEAYPNHPLHGEVLRIAPQARVEQNVTMFEVTCLVSNEDGLLKAGMNATVEMVLAQAEDVLTVPVRALSSNPPDGQPADSGKVVASGDTAPARNGGGRGGWSRGHRDSDERWAQVRSGSQRAWRKVEVGLSNLDRVAVTSGLAEGDTVVYTLVSGALQSRDEFRDRMRNMGPAGNMRRSGS